MEFVQWRTRRLTSGRLIVAILVISAVLAPSVAKAQPKQLLTAPYSDMYREREWCNRDAALVVSCWFDDDSQPQTGWIEANFGLTAYTPTLDENVPLRQASRVGVWQAFEVRRVNRHAPPTITVTYHLDGGWLRHQASDHHNLSAAELSLWAKVYDRSCFCFLTDPQVPQVKIASITSNGMVEVPEQDVVLEFRLDHIPAGHVPSGWLELRTGLGTEAVIGGHGHGTVEGHARGTLTSIAIH